MITQALFVNYPKGSIKDKDYVVYPVKKKNGKWVGASVLLPVKGEAGGYISVENDPVKREFNTEAECLTACGIKNTFSGYTKDEVEAVVSVSMGLTSMGDYPNSIHLKKKNAKGTVTG